VPDPSDQFLVSVVIPTFERREMLRGALASVVAQTDPRWEAVVVDDASTDGTFEEVEAWSRREPRIRVVRRVGERRGAAVCRNQGVTASRGGFVLFLDSDDLLDPWCLERRRRAMEADPGLDFVVFPCRLFRERPGDTGLLFNADTGEDDLDRFLRRDYPWQTTGPLYRRAALDRIGPFVEELVTGQTWEFTVRSVALGLRYARFPGPDHHYRLAHATSMTRRIDTPLHLACYRVLLGRLLDVLSARGLLTRARRDRLVSLHAWLVRLARDVGNRPAAIDAWNDARERRLVGPVRHALVSAWLAKPHGSIAYRLGHHFVKRRWPNAWVLEPSTTFLKTKE
jgi:glycosyltransferase involved in cell wall biosynthesis